MRCKVRFYLRNIKALAYLFKVIFKIELFVRGIVSEWFKYN